MNDKEDWVIMALFFCVGAGLVGLGCYGVSTLLFTFKDAVVVPCLIFWTNYFKNYGRQTFEVFCFTWLVGAGLFFFVKNTNVLTAEHAKTLEKLEEAFKKISYENERRLRSDYSCKELEKEKTELVQERSTLLSQIKVLNKEIEHLKNPEIAEQIKRQKELELAEIERKRSEEKLLKIVNTSNWGNS